MFKCRLRQSSNYRQRMGPGRFRESVLAVTATDSVIRNAGAISSPVRSTNHVAASGVNPPITPKQILQPSDTAVHRTCGGAASTKSGVMCRYRARETLPSGRHS